MEHFYQKIPGWFSFRGLYGRMVRQAKDGAHFVEVGSWKGRSACFMAVEIANSRKRILFDCVDTWKGSQEPKHLEDPSVKNGTLFSEFMRNTEPIKRFISNVVVMESVQAAKQYGDRSLDFVFIDAAHDYQNVKADLEAWLPKIKPAGLLAGDDFYHQGVKRAVTERFGESVKLQQGSGTGWQWCHYVGE